MKKIITLLFITTLFLMFSSCSDDEFNDDVLVGKWQQKGDKCESKSYIIFDSNLTVTDYKEYSLSVNDLLETYCKESKNSESILGVKLVKTSDKIYKITKDTNLHIIDKNTIGFRDKEYKGDNYHAVFKNK